MFLERNEREGFFLRYRLIRGEGLDQRNENENDEFKREQEFIDDFLETVTALKTVVA